MSGRVVTITELAQKAGVSTTTVSIVLNQKPQARRVSETTRKRIWELAESLSYRPNRLALAMQRQSTGIIGFVCGDSATPYYAELTEQLANEANRRGCQLLMTPTVWDTRREIDTMEMLLTRAVDGVIMCSQAFENCSESTERIKRAYHGVVPLVTINAESVDISTVQYDYEPGMIELFKYFRRNDIRSVALLDDPEFPIKRQVFTRLVGEFGLEPRLVDFSFRDMETLKRAAEKVLADRPDAVLATSDLTAMHFCSCAGQAGIRIPEDLSVAAIDCSQLSAFYNPPLSGIRTDPALFIGEVFDELERKINGVPEIRTIRVPSHLEIRKSIKVKS